MGISGQNIQTNRMSLEGDGSSIKIRKLAPDEPAQLITSLNARGYVRVPAELLERVKVQSGDVLDMDLQGDELNIKIFDKNNIPDRLFDPVTVEEGKAPPGWICQAFTANPSSHIYARSGKNAVKVFDSLLKKHGTDYRDLKSIFDFGCGAGRVLSHFNKSCDADLYGVDLHESAIKWCQTKLDWGNFGLGQQSPPLGFSNSQFDFIYAISVFTHLDEKMQDSWLEELNRLATPGAILILSYRGEDFIEKIIGPKRQKIINNAFETSGGFFFEEHTRWEGVFPSYYADAYHTHEYIKSHWGKYFDVLELVPSGGFSNRQNAAVLRKV